MPSSSSSGAGGAIEAATCLATTTKNDAIITSDNSPAPPRSAGSFVVIAQHDSLQWSRHETSRLPGDYEFVCKLGQGAFGVVFQVRHRLDGHLYALKRIRLKQQHAQEKKEVVLREVAVLSRIQHPHVVRYFGAFVEKGVVEDHCCGGSKNDDFDAEWCSSQEETTTADNSETLESSNSMNADPVCHLCRKTYTDWEVSFADWGLIDSVLQPLNLCTECYLSSLPNSLDVSQINIRPAVHHPEHLFILMEYCDQTLSEAAATAHSSETLWSYFLQSLEGLCYLHDKDIIHRDLNMSNIFLRQSVVKIGDLGLAVVRQASCSNSGALLDNESQQTTKTSTPPKSSLSQDVGTYLYMAPEVATGHYNQACDVYSLGVVLVELLYRRFSTAMERADVLGRVRREVRLPDDVCGKDHNNLADGERQLQQRVAALVPRMLALDPAQRWTSRELWEKLTIHRADDESLLPPAEEGSNRAAASRSPSVVDQLGKELQQKDELIARLRQLLNEHGIAHGHLR